MSATVRDERERVIVVNQDDELRAFLLVVRRALLLIVRYIEAKYGLRDKSCSP